MPLETYRKKKPVPTPRSAATWSPKPDFVPPDQADRQRAFRASGGIPKKTPSTGSSLPTVANPLGPQIPGYSAAQSDFIWEQVKAAQLPAQQKIDDAQRIAQQNTAAGQEAIKGYYGALGPLLERIAPAVQQGYSQAAGMDALLGRGFGNTVASGDAALNASNAAAMNLTGGTMPPVDNSPIGNALGWLGGGLPAQGLNVTGAAANAEAARMPGLIQAAGGEQVGALARAQAEADKEFGVQRANLAAQMPGLVLEYGQQAIENALTAQKASAAGYKVFGSAKSGYFAINPSTGKTTRLTNPTPGAEGTTKRYERVYEDDAGNTWGVLADGTGIEKLPGYAKAAEPKIYKTSNGGILEYDPATGAMQWRVKPVVKPGAMVYYDDVYGRRIQVDPSTNSQQAISTGKWTDPNTKDVFRVEADGTHTLISKGKPKGATPPKITPSFTNQMANQIYNWRRGFTGSQYGKPVKGATPMDYDAVLAQAIARGNGTAAWRKKAIQLVQTEWGGNPVVEANLNARDAKKAKHKVSGAIALALDAVEGGDWDFPAHYLIEAIARTYNLPLSALSRLVEELTEDKGLRAKAIKGVYED